MDIDLVLIMSIIVVVGVFVVVVEVDYHSHHVDKVRIDYRQDLVMVQFHLGDGWEINLTLRMMVMPLWASNFRSLWYDAVQYTLHKYRQMNCCSY